jgi:16S rRNA processing protein RimM
MIPFDDCIHAGKITRKWGFENELIIRLGNNMPQGFSLPDYIFVLLDNRLIPFGIKTLQHDGDRKFTVAFHDTSSAMREKLVQKEIYLFKEELSRAETEKVLQAQEEEEMLIGYLVITTGQLEIGRVTQVMERVIQPLLVTDCNGKEGLIPFTPDIVKVIDHDKQTIVVELPDGLIELF